MRILVAPDSYKGSLTAVAVAAAMARGILSVFPGADVIQVPIADGARAPWRRWWPPRAGA